MADVLWFSLGGLAGLVAWNLAIGPLFHGFMHGLMGISDPSACLRDQQEGF
jgi:hypothetical protein